MNAKTPLRLDGKVVLITGASGGIGFEAAVPLAEAGARVVIVGRNPAKTRAALNEIKRRTNANDAEMLLCDFSSQAAIRRLAETFRACHARLDVLVNNVGGVHGKRELTEDGIEATFAVNHLGPFLLTNLVLDLLTVSAPARVVNVASAAHYRGTLDLDDPGFEHGYRIMRAYARSKLANVLFTRELAKRLDGTGVSVNAVHPGAVATHIWDGAPRWTQPVLSIAKKFFMRTPYEGARGLVHLAVSPEVEGISGLYFEDNRPKEPSSLARDDVLAKRLWTKSARLTNLQ